MSGRYPSHTGVGPSVIRPSRPYALPKAEVTIAEKFKEAGYATHAGEQFVFLFAMSVVSINATLQTIVETERGQWASGTWATVTSVTRRPSVALTLSWAT